MLPEQISFIVSSDPDAGAVNVSSDGSAFEVQLDDGLQIPREALHTTVRVEEATVWWVIPNIITDQNDKMFITGPLVGGAINNFVITIPQGLYDLSGLNAAIQRELENQGAQTDPNPILNLAPDGATQKVEVRLNYTNVSIDFTQLGTPRAILGFNTQIIGPSAVAPIEILAPNIAAFNQVNYFLIHSDLVNQGIRFNNRYNQTISQILIDVAPGSQIVNKPFNPARSNAQELAGTKRTNLRFYLTDDKQRPVNTNNEYWTARIVIEYLLPYVIK